MGLFENLKLLRKKNGYSQQQIAEYLGIDTTSYGRIERGDRSLNIDRLDLLAKFYNVSVVNILSGIEKESATLLNQENSNEFLEYLRQENQFLRSSILAKDSQIEFLIELNKEYKAMISLKKK